MSDTKVRYYNTIYSIGQIKNTIYRKGIGLFPIPFWTVENQKIHLQSDVVCLTFP